MAGLDDSTRGARLCRSIVIGVVIAAMAAPPSARAGEAERTQAELLFQKAVEAVKAGRTAEACPLFEESDRLDPQPGTEYELAKCYESIGRTASAWSRYLEVAEKIDARGDREKAEKVRQRVREAVEPKLARLTIAVPEAVAKLAGLEVKRDGTLLPRPLWGTAVPVDPGTHQVRASAPGKSPWEGSIDVSTPGGTVVVHVPELRDEAIAPPPLPPPPPVVSALPPPAPPSSAWSGQRIGGLVLGGAGLVGIAIGAGFGAAALAKGSTWKQLTMDKCNNAALDCDSPATVTEIRGIERDRSTYATASTIGLIAGAAAAGAGLALFLTAPRAPAEPPRAAAFAVLPWVQGGSAGLIARGAF